MKQIKEFFKDLNLFFRIVTITLTLFVVVTWVLLAAEIYTQINS